MAFLRRLGWWLRADRHEREAADELAFHLELEMRQLESEGVPPEEAEAIARRKLGNTGRINDSLRDGWRFRAWDALTLDLRFALRTLRAKPTFALVVIATLALGIGACTTAFGFINAFLWRPMPFQEPQQLVHVWESDLARGDYLGGRVSRPVFEAWSSRTRSFSGLAAFNYTEQALADDGGAEPQRIPVGLLSANAFRVLGIAPMLGRDFADGEDLAGAAPVALLSWELWQARYQASPTILGRTIMLEEVPHVVVGVMPPGTAFPLSISRVWRPYQFSVADYPISRKSLQVAARLAPGVSPGMAQDELSALAATLQSEFPVEQRDRGATIVPLREALNFADEVLRPLSLALAGATLAILLVASANVASLLLARTGVRAGEFAVRAALGAGAGRLSRQLLTESAVLGVLGALGGAALSLLALRAVDQMVPPDLYRIGAVSVGSTELLVALAAGLVAASVSTIIPARIARSGRLFQGLRDGVVTVGGRGRAQRLLVAAQLALTLALLVGAALLLRSANALRDVPLGFEAEEVASGKVILPASRYPDGEALALAHTRLLAAVRSGPGIRSAASVNHLPLNHETANVGVHVTGTERLDESQQPSAVRVTVSEGYFATLGLDQLAGRDFNSVDGSDAPPVTVVNAEFVARYLGGAAPVGRTVELGLAPGRSETVMVIGVVENAAQVSIAGGFEPVAYRPVSQVPGRYFRIVAAGIGGPAAVLGDLPRLVHEVDPLVPVDELRTLGAVVDEFLLANRMLSGLLLILAGSALALALVGTYGVISLMVGARRREFGIRLALGASQGRMIGGVMIRGLILVVISVVIGNLLALALARLMASFLHGVRPTEPLVYAAVSTTLLFAGLAACVVPALRAARADPLRALRAES